MRWTYTKMRQNGNVCTVVWEGPLRVGPWRAGDAVVDWDVHMEDVSS